MPTVSIPTTKAKVEVGGNVEFGLTARKKAAFGKAKKNAMDSNLPSSNEEIDDVDEGSTVQKKTVARYRQPTAQSKKKMKRHPPEPNLRRFSKAVQRLRRDLHRRHITTGQLFTMMDKDRGGNITFLEFQRGVAMSGVRPIPGII